MAESALSRLTYILLGFFAFFFSFGTVQADSPLLTPEENLWLKTRNNTIVVYPEKNNPPFSYQSASGIIQGLSVDYLELIADKIGAKIEYLTPRSRSQILSDVAEGKGDVILALTPSPNREEIFLFTESYITVPVVVVVRKDSDVRRALSLSDFSGKRVAMVEGSAVQEYIQENYPRVVREGVTDDEVGLQQVVLGEVEAVTMDVASLSYLLSKQVLNSVKIAGNTGYDYRPAFSMAKGQEILQSILEKGLIQISTNDRQTLTEKWVVLPGEQVQKKSIFQWFGEGTGVVLIYILLIITIFGIAILIFRRRHLLSFYNAKKVQVVNDLQNEIAELEGVSKNLTAELEEVKNLEQNIQEKIKKLEG